MANDHGEQIRIVQETVAGKEITFAHVMGGPAPIIYQKLGLNPHLDYRSSAIGVMNMTPPESAVYHHLLFQVRSYPKRRSSQ